MNRKSIVKPIAKFALKFGLNFGLGCAADAVAKKPEKGKQVTDDVASLGDLIKTDAIAIGDGKYDEMEKTVSDAKCDVLVDRIFNY